MPASPAVHKKRLFVFCDGTGQDGLLSWEVSEDKEKLVSPFDIDRGLLNPEKQSLAAKDRYASNVFRLSRCIAQQAEDGTLQIVYYQSGVGVPTNFEGDDSHRLASATGLAVASKIRDAYNFIVQNYAPGDEIYLFGFSRGAYTARKVAGLLDQLGLLNKKQMSKFFEHWKQLLRGTLKPQPDGGKLGTPVSVQFLGVWDTVGYIIKNIWPWSKPLGNLLGFKDNGLPGCVLQARHALSYHEKRFEFLCTPFMPETHPERLVQVWFPGVHSDIGGGYKEHQIADLSLLWMSGELAKLNVKLDEDYLDTRLSAGKSELEVHEENSYRPDKDGKRLGIFNETKDHSSTYYHRSLWGKFKHIDPRYQGELDRLTKTLVLIPKKMAPFSEVEKKFWARRWAHFIPDPTKDKDQQPGYEHMPIELPSAEHDAPLEEESPDVLFE